MRACDIHYKLDLLMMAPEYREHYTELSDLRFRLMNAMLCGNVQEQRRIVRDTLQLLKTYAADHEWPEAALNAAKGEPQQQERRADLT